MAHLERTIDLLCKLPHQQLDEGWVKNVWDCDFNDIEPISIDIQEDIQEAEYLVSDLEALHKELIPWINHSSSNISEGDGFWAGLVENDISHKSLIALFAYLIDLGIVKTADFQKKISAIYAASAYVKLITISGSSAFKVFHPVLFERIVDILKQYLNVGSTFKRKRGSSPSQSQQRKKGKGKNKRSKNSSLEEVQNFEDENAEEEEENEEVVELSPRELSTIHSCLTVLLKDIVSYVKCTSLRHSETTLYHTIQMFAKLTKFEAEIFNGNFEPENLNSYPVPGLAYKGLQFMCQSLHGHVQSCCNSVCKHLLPNILMLIGDKGVSVASIPREVNIARQHAVKFICFLIKEIGEKFMKSCKTLLQHMCTKVPDKVDYRSKVAESVVFLMKALPVEIYGGMLDWLYRLSTHSTMNYRAFACDVVALMLDTEERDTSSGDIANETQNNAKHTSLLKLLVDRCSDASPTVRARAIAAFGQCFLSNVLTMKASLKDIVTPQVRVGNHALVRYVVPTPEGEARSQTVSESDATDERTLIQSQEAPDVGETPINAAPAKDPKTPFPGVMLTPYNPNLPDDAGVISMIRRRTRDEKVHVRKAALQVLENVLKFESPEFTRQNLEALVERCRDPALSVRKQALQSLTDLLLAMPSEKPLQQAWLDGVMPLVIDRETSLQEKCLELIEDILLKNVVPAKRVVTDSHKLAWEILAVIEQVENVELRRFLQKSCIHWGRIGKINQALINALESHIETANNKVAWMLLAELAPSAPKLGSAVLLKYWREHSSATDEEELTTLKRVLTVMSCAAKHLGAEDRSILIETLKQRLLKFDSPPELIAVTIKTLSKLCSVEGNENGKEIQNAWCEQLLKASDKYLSHVILEQDGRIEDEDLVVRHLFTLGEIVQICPQKVQKRIILVVQSMIASPCITNMPLTQTNTSGTSDHWNGKNLSGQSDQQPSSQESSDHPHALPVPSSSDIHQTQVTCTQVLSQFRGSNMSNRIRAFAFITLGKLCLQNPDLAKKVVAALAKELETATDTSTRSNAIMVLCDLCVRYTTTADRYIGNIATCLKDPSPLIRKQTLILITRLLQEDFMKWKGVLFFRFICTILDQNKDIADFAEFCLVHMLMIRHPTMFFQHFMECIFHFNDYKGFGAFNSFKQSEREKRMFKLHGKDNFVKRHTLYNFMLEHMADEHRFKITAKLCQEILAGFVDGIIQLNDQSAAVLKDTLVVLGSKNIKLRISNTKKAQEDVGGDEQEMAAIVLATAKKTLISQVVKKNVIENIVPIVLSLKHMLEKHRSSLLQDLMHYLRELMKDYKTEIKDILAADKQLASEVEFDLRRFEEGVLLEENSIPQSSQNKTPALPADNGVVIRMVTEAVTPATPDTEQQPIPKTPVADAQRSRVSSPAPQTPKTPVSTPARNLLLQAVINSGKKMMEASKKQGTASKPSKGRKSTVRYSVPLVQVNSVEDDEDGMEESPPSAVGNDVHKLRTPGQGGKRNTRAISTPSGALNNITFHMDQNITMIPPSPIPTAMRIRIYDNDSENITPQASNSRSTKTVPEDVILMFSPEKPAPQPKEWNVHVSDGRNSGKENSLSSQLGQKKLQHRASTTRGARLENQNLSQIKTRRKKGN